MKLFNKLIEPFVEQNSKTIGPNNNSNNTSNSRKNKVCQVRVEKIEDNYAEAPHEIRLNHVKNGYICRQKWREFAQYIREDEGRENSWGLKKQHIDRENGNTCIKHEGVTVDKRQIEHQNKSQHTCTRNNSTAVTGDISGSLPGLGGKVGSTETTSTGRSNTKVSSPSETKNINECITEKKYCPINKRMFIRAGNFWTTVGQTKESQVDMIFERENEKLSSESGSNM